MTDVHITAQGHLVLGPELTIPFAAAWRESLLDAVALRDGDLQVDLSGVTDIDSAGLQLLLAGTRTLAARGHTLEIMAASATVRDALTVFGLQALLPAAALQE